MTVSHRNQATQLLFIPLPPRLPSSAPPSPEMHLLKSFFHSPKPKKMIGVVIGPTYTMWKPCFFRDAVHGLVLQWTDILALSLIFQGNYPAFITLDWVLKLKFPTIFLNLRTRQPNFRDLYVLHFIRFLCNTFFLLIFIPWEVYNSLTFLSVTPILTFVVSGQTTRRAELLFIVIQEVRDKG